MAVAHSQQGWLTPAHSRQHHSCLPQYWAVELEQPFAATCKVQNWGLRGGMFWHTVGQCFLAYMRERVRHMPGCALWCKACSCSVLCLSRCILVVYHVLFITVIDGIGCLLMALPLPDCHGTCTALVLQSKIVVRMHVRAKAWHEAHCRETWDWQTCRGRMSPPNLSTSPPKASSCSRTSYAVAAVRPST